MAFGVTVDFTANVAKFTDQVDRLSGNLDKFGKKAESSFKLAKNAFGVFAGAFAANSLVNEFNQIVDAGDRLQKLSLRLGDSVENLSRLQLVAQLSGVSFETMTIGLQRMTRRVSDAARGSGEAVKAIDELGLSAQRLGSLSQTDQLKAFADAFIQIENAGDQVRLSQKIFDSGGVAILQAMQKGAAGIDEMIAASDRLGTTLSTDAANSMARFNDNLTTLEGSFRGVRNEIVEASIPALNSFLELISNAPKPIAELEAELERLETRLSSTRQGRGRGAITNRIEEIKDEIQSAQIAQGDIKGFESRVAELDVTIAKLQDRLANASKITTRRRGPQRASEFTQINNQLKEFIDERTALLDRLAAPAAGSIIGDIQRTASVSIAPKIKTASFKAPKINIELESERAEEKLEALNQRVISIFNPDLANFNRGLANAQDALNTGFFNEDEFKAEVETLVTDFNRGTEPIISRLDRMFNPDLVRLREAFQIVTDAQQSQEIGPVDASVNFLALAEQYRSDFIQPAKDGTDELSVFADQAARNMQDAFANFLFDPFNDGLDGLVKSFATVLQRMAAEAAASGIFDLFKDSGVGSAIFSGIGDILTGSFHDGGVIGQDSGRMMAVNPVVFAGAERFHSGGYPGLKSDEVPAILQTGERVLSRVEVSLFAKLLQILDSKQSVVDIQKLVAPVFHQGGAVGGYAPHKMIDPFLFLGARRYHDGGTISGGGLSSSSYNTQSGNLGGISVSTTVNVSGSETTRDNANRLGDQLNSRIMEVLAQEKRPGGLLNS